ncbi:MAG: Sir2 silent information regulator family NAD-dependent deacetylase [Actinobacteria bacterium]|nr:Sir2 silent information regulator family NAD-dependent deacetylase [Actinomycetota bacterium]
MNAVADAINGADHVLIGGGAGLSAAAGLDYAGKRFEDNFADFIDTYGIEDMYSGSFYPFETPEELWAHWARHIMVNRFDHGSTALYEDLAQLVADKDHFIITTNVESQFALAGFSTDRIFEVQGNYAYLQCAIGCHDRLYDNEQLMRQMVIETKNCRIPSHLVPKCPKCGGPMGVNIRHNDFFVQDTKWNAARDRYTTWLQEAQGSRIVLLELGVGFNTPGIIRHPFESMARFNQQVTLVRMNRDHPFSSFDSGTRILSFPEDIHTTITRIMATRCAAR